MVINLLDEVVKSVKGYMDLRIMFTFLKLWNLHATHDTNVFHHLLVLSDFEKEVNMQTINKPTDLCNI